MPAKSPVTSRSDRRIVAKAPSKAAAALPETPLGRDLVVPGLGRHPRVRDVVRVAIARSTQDLLRYDEGVRRGVTVDDLRHFRVATRRLRSDLRTLRPLLHREWADGLRSELRWLGAEIGPVRDLDVLTIRMASRSKALDEIDGAAVARIHEMLTAERERSRVRLLRALGSARYLTLLDHLIDAVNEPEFLDDAIAGSSGSRELPGLVRSAWKDVRKAAIGLSLESPDETLHDVRIMAKRCRYAAEVAQLAAGRDAKRFAGAIRSLQRVLGEHQDTVIAEAWLRTTAAADPSLGLVAGLIIAAERADRVRLRLAVPSTWASIDRPELRDWLD